MTTPELAQKFLTYCEAHPDQRFMQALKNWLKVGYLEVNEDPLIDETGAALRTRGADTYEWSNEAVGERIKS